MQGVDWLIVALYLGGMLALAARLSRRQRSRRDYYLGGNDLSPVSLATSTIATQCSTNSLLGAPAFVGFTLGGGMIWLQYELAVPIAMLLLVWLLGSIRRSNHISAYAFLQERLGTGARLLASSTFLLFRGVATGVTVYGVAIVVTLLVDVSYTQAVLLCNGMLRFPVVLLYCLLGLALAAYASQDPGFLAGLPTNEHGAPNHNLVYPAYVLSTFPPGLVGQVMVGIFAAAMSSIDSSLNALSAATIEDYVSRSGVLSERALFVASKVATLAWGVFAVAFSYQVERIAPTVLEAINKIGSMSNGPLLALFGVALLTPGVGQAAAVVGFAAGLLGNALIWWLLPGVSWLWWNVSGCLIALAVAALSGRVNLTWPTYAPDRSSVVALTSMAGLILAVCAWFGVRG